jgi:hypothetical protein
MNDPAKELELMSLKCELFQAIKRHENTLSDFCAETAFMRRARCCVAREKYARLFSIVLHWSVVV